MFSQKIELLKLTGEQENELSIALSGLTDKRIEIYIEAIHLLKSKNKQVINFKKFINTLNNYILEDVKSLISAIELDFYIGYFFYNYDWRSELYIKNMQYFKFTDEELFYISKALTNWKELNNESYEAMQLATPKMCAFVYSIGFKRRNMLLEKGSSPLNCRRKHEYLRFYHDKIDIFFILVDNLVALIIFLIYFGMFCVMLLIAMLCSVLTQITESELNKFFATCDQIIIWVLMLLFLLVPLMMYKKYLEDKLDKLKIKSNDWRKL